MDRERVHFQNEAVDRGVTAEAAAPKAAREMRINKGDLEAYGYDGDCPQCKHIIKYGKSRKGTSHSMHCRKRIVEAMSKTEDGRRRIEVNEERITRTMAEQLEVADQEPPVVR